MKTEKLSAKERVNKDRFLRSFLTKLIKYFFLFVRSSLSLFLPNHLDTQ